MPYPKIPITVEQALKETRCWPKRPENPTRKQLRKAALRMRRKWKLPYYKGPGQESLYDLEDIKERRRTMVVKIAA